MRNYIIAILVMAGLATACTSGNKSEGESGTESKGEVNIYTHRHYESDQQLFKKFEEETGIKVNVVNANADELIQKMQLEGENSPADVLITVDAGRLSRAKTSGLLQPITSAKLDSVIPAHLKDKDKHWFGLTYRARVIAYDPNKVNPEEVKTYADLTDPKWKGEVLIRSSFNTYNQSLLASIIAHEGEEGALEWAKGMVTNFAREPKGADRDQVKALAAGQGSLAVLNTYYVGKMLNSDNPEEVKAGEFIKLIFPNQEGRGTHINVSGAGVAKYAPNKENAVAFIEFLASAEAQEIFAKANFEYPANPAVEWADLLQSWGEFKTDTLDLSKLGEYNGTAVRVFDQAGWK